MRYELSDGEWGVIKPMLPNKTRGVPRVDDVAFSTVSSGCCGPEHRGAICRSATDPTPLATIASSVGAAIREITGLARLSAIVGFRAHTPGTTASS